MKRLISVAAACVTGALLLVAQRPLLVGHRGSGTGLENSVESFTVGAKRGYEYLETDFKVTKDKQFVCTHDDNTTRLGGTLTIASSTLAELQSETLSQTRGGVKYTGRLCSAQEYLDVCRQYGAKPLIELKWATGVNSNDQSNIPLLIKLIEDNGFRDKCIILTSMKPCLEYIRKNYPDIKLQFLTGEYWSSHFDWCVANKIDVDIQAGYFNAETVKKFHDNGLIVNMWTANTDASYRTYAEMGCDMITTDSLDPDKLPEITILPDEEPDTDEPQPVDLAFERLWIMSNTTDNHPGNIDGTNAQQGTAVDGTFYINNCVDKKIYMFDSTGLIGTLDGGSGWGCARDTHGNIVVRDDKLSGDQHSFIIYARGAKPGDTPASRFTATVPLTGQTNFINADGNLLDSDGGHIYLFPNKQSAINIINVKNGNVVDADRSYGVTMTGTAAGYVIPFTGRPTRWLYQIRATGLAEYNNGHTKDIITGRSSTSAPNRNSTGGGAYFSLKGNKILIHNSGANYLGGFTVRNHTTGQVITSVDPIGTLGYVTGGNYSTFNWLIPEKAGDSQYLIYQYCPANGIACYRLYDKTSGVDTIEAATEMPAVYYNLNGMRVDNPASGLYIVRRGDRVSKEIVR